jgi:hypothetical protein
MRTLIFLSLAFTLACNEAKKAPDRTSKEQVIATEEQDIKKAKISPPISPLAKYAFETGQSPEEVNQTVSTLLVIGVKPEQILERLDQLARAAKQSAVNHYDLEKSFRLLNRYLLRIGPQSFRMVTCPAAV